MKSYSQNAEDLFIQSYFGDYKGTLLSIGENNGTDLSNAKLLIDHGWKAILFEPGITCLDLYKLHSGNSNVVVYNLGVGDKDEQVDFYESGAHIKNGSDRGLVSTCDFEETKRWPDVEFTKRTINLVPFSMIETEWPFDYISIDAEGQDLKILRQMNLTALECKCLCIEWNSSLELKLLFTEYCDRFGLKLAHTHAENLIFTQ